MRLKPPLQLHPVRLRGLPAAGAVGIALSSSQPRSATASCTGIVERSRCPRCADSVLS